MNTSLSSSAGASRSSSRRHSLTLGALAAALIGLAGCTVVPNYVRPEVKTNADYASQSMLQQRDATRAAPELDAWWQGFDDPELRSEERR